MNVLILFSLLVLLPIATTVFLGIAFLALIYCDDELYDDAYRGYKNGR